VKNNSAESETRMNSQVPVIKVFLGPVICHPGKWVLGNGPGETLRRKLRIAGISVVRSKSV